MAKVRYCQKIDDPEPGNRVLHSLRQVRNRHCTNTPQPSLSSRICVLTNLLMYGIDVSMKYENPVVLWVIGLILLAIGLSALVILVIG